jgi:multiple sugar transport system permease protein
MAVPEKVAVLRQPAARRQGRASLLERENVLGYLLLLPAALLLLVFVAYPFLYGLWLSLTDARIGQPATFIGIQNFVNLLEDTIFLQAARNSFLYTFVTTIFKLILGLFMAVVLNQRFRFQRVVRGSALLPWIIPTVLSTLAWLWLFDATFSVFNWMLRQIGIRGPIWLATSPWPMISIMIINIWRGMPFYGISFLAGMQTIPQDLYEAATIDGASAWQRFTRVTLPLLRPVISVVLLLSTILTFADFQIVYVLTRGGPANQTHLFATYAFQVGLSGTRIGEGAAISLYMFPVLAIVVALTLISIRKED